MLRSVQGLWAERRRKNTGLMDLSELLSPERIRCHSDVQSKKRALQTLAEMLSVSLQAPIEATEEDAEESEQTGSIGSLANRILGKVNQPEVHDSSALSEMCILDAFIGRERLGSTCLDHGFALPHCRIADIDEPIAALLTLREGVDYDGSNKMAVDLMLGLLVPEDCNDEHLQILATLAKRFSDAEFRNQMRTHTDPNELYDYLCSLAPTE